MCDKEEEISFVARAQNWEQRVTVEMEAARMWDDQWGSLYAKGEATSYEQKIAALEDEMKKLPNTRMSSVSNISFKDVKGYPEWHDCKRRSFERINAQQQNEALEC